MSTRPTRGTRRSLTVGAVGVLAAAALTSGVALAPAATAKGLDVRTSGACSTGSWKLKAKAEDRRIEVELELDTNRVGQTWRYSVTDNGVALWSGSGITAAPSGSFEVRRVVSNRAGSDVLRATLTNARTGTVCRAALTYPG